MLKYNKLGSTVIFWHRKLYKVIQEGIWRLGFGQEGETSQDHVSSVDKRLKEF